MSEQSEPTGTELVPVEGGVNRQEWMPVPAVFGGVVPVRPQFTNLPRDREHAPLLSKAAVTRELVLENALERVCLCKWLLVLPIRKVDPRSGEIAEWVRCVMISADGECVATNSRTVLDQLASIVQQIGQGPWEPPLRLRITSVKGGAFGKYHQLELLPDDKPKKGK